VVITISVTKTADTPPLDLTVRTAIGARAVVEMTPPFLGTEPNPSGDRIQFRMEDFGVGTTTATYGPGSAILTEAERRTVIDDIVLPLYRAKIGILPLSSSILDFKLPVDKRRAALKVLRKQRLSDGIAVYAKFDTSPDNDAIPPLPKITTVEGIVPREGTREVLLGKTTALIGYEATDDQSMYNDYISFETSLGGAVWKERKYVRALKLTDLQEGTNWFYVRAKDFAGNLSVDPSSPAALLGSAKIVVDTLPPQTKITQAPPDFIASGDVTVAFDGDDAGSGVVDYQVNIDGTDFGFGINHARSVSGFAEGPHSVTVFARDKVGHVDPNGASARFTVDFTAPKTSLVGTRTGFTRPGGAKFSAYAQDNYSTPSSVKLSSKLEGPSCERPEFSGFESLELIDLTGCVLNDGAYKLSVRSRDQAGNIEATAAEVEFVVDGRPPAVAIMDTPPARSTDLVSHFVVAGTDNVTASEELQYMYRVRGAFDDFSAPIYGTEILLPPLPTGDYTFEVTAIDLAGNHSPLQGYEFSVDNRPPRTMVAKTLPTWSSDLQVVLDASGEDDRTDSLSLEYSVVLDNNEISRAKAPVVLASITEGRHTVRISAVDDFGNVDPEGVFMTFSVDRTPPETKLEAAPVRFSTGTFRPAPSGTDNLTAQDELRYMYRVIRGAHASAWSDPQLAADVAINLRETGPVRIELAAIDNAGLIDPTPISFGGEVKAPAVGCQCSANQETSASDLVSMILLTVAVVAARKRRRSSL
jgi:hypothetical protein